jgi:hypothetical protein
MSSQQGGKDLTYSRQEIRYNECVQNLTVAYEGSAEEIILHAPDLSARGMFINTPNHLPEGTVLQVSFQLARSNFEVLARCEVRYCLPGVGIGVEFIEISPKAQRAIKNEIRTNLVSSPRKT